MFTSATQKRHEVLLATFLERRSGAGSAAAKVRVVKARERGGVAQGYNFCAARRVSNGPPEDYSTR
jgi:hypothetical protein